MTESKKVVKDFESENIIQIIDLEKIYGEGNIQINALQGINLKIKKGTIVSIMGPSGSGKSTLLNILGTMDTPTSGEVLVNGIDFAKLKEKSIAKYRRKTIGFVFQNFYLLPNLDVLGNVLSPLIPYGISVSEKNFAIELIEKVGLKGREKSTVRKLSGGESQRVAIARALINNPDIILADEPTGNLDSVTGKSIIDLLLVLVQQGKTVIIVTHDPRIGQMVTNSGVGQNVWLQDGKLSDKPTYDVFCYDVDA